VTPRHSLYSEYSRRVMNIVRQASPLVEQMSIDEAFLDLTEEGSPWEAVISRARDLQQRVRQEVGLSASLGVAANKLVAKVASDRDKPGGLTVVPPGEEAAFLAPLPVRVLWGVGPVTADKLAEMGVTTVKDLTQVPEEELRARFGSHGASMARQALGIDRRPVVTQHERKSISQERTFERDIADLDALKRHLWTLSQRVSRYLKRSGVAAGTIAIKLRYSDFSTLSRQMSLSVPIDDEVEIYRAALTLFQRAWEPGRPIRLLGVGGHRLTESTGQLALW